MDKCICVPCIVVLFVGLLEIVSTSRHLGLRSPDFCTPLVIAHRGASGYVPEHTLGAYALAIVMGADYIEPDLVMTRDGYLIARHENELSLTTDIAERPQFASRYRNNTIDGVQTRGWFSEDFSLAEIKTLRSKELLQTIRVGNTRMDGVFEIPTLQEIIDLAKGFEYSEKRIIGIYPEIKHATHFQQLGLAMEKTLVDLLHENEYRGAEAPIYIQSMEVSNLKELKEMTDLKLLQLFSSNHSRQPYDQAFTGTSLTYADMATAAGLSEIATYAAAVGPEKSAIIPRTSNNTLGTPTTFVQDAHSVGLKVHPYTFRAENNYLPAEFRSQDGLDASLGDSAGEMRVYLEAGIDGLFTDQPDILANLRGPCTQNNLNGNNANALWLSNSSLILISILLFFT